MNVVGNLYELEVVEGLARIAADELTEGVTGVKDVAPGYPRADGVRFTYSGSLSPLLRLRMTQAVYRVLTFAVPRPKALLGDQNFKTLTATVKAIVDAHPAGTFHSLGIAAAGAQSSVMQRIKQSLADQVKLTPADDRGDLLVRIRPTPDHKGWECLIRISPRPLATRPWRVRDFEGALNATVARAMNWMTNPGSDDIYVNLGCGSGSLMIERLDGMGAQRTIGVDIDAIALRVCAANAEAARRRSRIDLVRGDVTQLPLPDACANVLTADLPFGQRVSSHAENERMYPLLFDEAARIAAPGARFVLITHEIRLMERVLAASIGWRLEDQLRINLRGLHPCIYRLVRD
ncbi:MAG: methyltransferase domain-containing protein [Anaerolineae bacterium]|nr:methyltransferase domain-containing protein [Anaerolineae bacterium]